MPADPFAQLGVSRDATLDEVRAARRRLARELHPDRGGDERRMREVNIAFDAVVAHLTGRRPLRPEPAASDTGPPPPAAAPPTRQGAGATRDAPSFVVDVLPVEAYEALLVVTSWIGEVLVDEPPYLLEVHLHEPAPCWCRLDLVPDAGASTVSLTVAPVDSAPAPPVETVRDTWVALLNQLGDLGRET